MTNSEVKKNLKFFKSHDEEKPLSRKRELPFSHPKFRQFLSTKTPI